MGVGLHFKIDSQLRSVIKKSSLECNQISLLTKIGSIIGNRYVTENQAETLSILKIR